ncbi:MAG: RNB domain-containing ribonuclease [Polyangiaceae bacterium]
MSVASKVVTGRVRVNPRGFGFVAFPPGHEPESAFIAPPDLNGLLADDLVSGELEEKDGRYRLLTPELEERPRTQLFGEVGRGKGGAVLKVDPEVSNCDWPIRGKAPKPGTLVVAEIDGDQVTIAHEVSAADQSLERVIARHDLPREFPDDLEPLKRLPKSELTRRRDLRDMITLTIDAPYSRDLDDAVAALPADSDGAIRVLVSIADVDALVPVGSRLDEEARRRATSVYLAGCVLPMIPHALSEDALSLLPGVDRPSLTVELRIDPEGVVTAVDLAESVIRSDGRLAYEDVADFLDRGEERSIPKALRPTLRWLRTAVARLDVVRSARGGVSLLREEATVLLDADTREPTELSARVNTSAHSLIERLMVAANEAVAVWLHDRGLPALYRVHDEPPPEKVAQLTEAAHHLGLEAGLGTRLTPRALAAFERQFTGRANAPALYTVLGRMLGPARYDPEPSAHFGLAAPLYLHFTSPIRRYADLVVHRVVKAYLRGERDLRELATGLDLVAQHINDRARRAAKAEQERLRMLAARLFARRIGERMRGNVVSIKPFGLVVQLEDTGITATLALEDLPGGPHEMSPDGFSLGDDERRFVIGEQLHVQVQAVNETLGRIELRLDDSEMTESDDA